MNRKPAILAALTILVIVIAAGLWFFKPWTAFTSSTIDESLPTATSEVAAGQNGEGSAEAPAPAEPEVLGEGPFFSQDHATSGTAKFVRIGDETILRFAGFQVDNGPDLKVVMATDEQALRAGDYVTLGELKATNGNQNYPVSEPLPYVTIWCERFASPFGSAEVQL